METRAQKYISALDEDEDRTYADVAEMFNTSPGAVRGVIRRYNEKVHGVYTGYRNTVSLPESLLEISEPTPTDRVVTFEDFIKPEEAEKPFEIWTIDIERLPGVVFEWGPKHGKYTAERMMVEPSRMVSFAAKPLHGSVLFSSEFHHGRDQMLETLWNVMDRASIIVGYNSKPFDVKHINAELRDAGFNSYSQVKQIDLLQAIKNMFNYDYYHMKSMAKRWGLSELKMDNEGFELWRRCYNNDPEAWEIMKMYNMQDVRVTERLLLDNMSWLPSTIPNLGAWMANGESLCPACLSEDVYEDGIAIAGVSKYQAYTCNSCGYRSRGTRRIGTPPGLRAITR